MLSNFLPRPSSQPCRSLPSLFRALTITAPGALPSEPQASSPKPPPASSASRLLSLDRGRASSPRRSKTETTPERQTTAARYLQRYEVGGVFHERALRRQQENVEVLRMQKTSTDYLRQMPRKWEVGDVYSPHDLSFQEMEKWRKRSMRRSDVVDALGIRPLDMYKNFSFVQDFTSSSGQILHSKLTGLRPVNQRQIAKMIRRVQGMGIYPTIHDHPEMIRNQFFPRLE